MGPAKSISYTVCNKLVEIKLDDEDVANFDAICMMFEKMNNYNGLKAIWEKESNKQLSDLYKIMVDTYWDTFPQNDCEIDFFFEYTVKEDHINDLVDAWTHDMAHLEVEGSMKGWNEEEIPECKEGEEEDEE